MTDQSPSSSEHFNYVSAFLFVAAISRLVGTVRAVGSADTAHAVLLVEHLFYLFVFGHFLLSGCFRVRLSLYSLLMVALLCFSAFWGTVNQNLPFNIAVDVSRAAAFFLVFELFQSAPRELIEAQLPTEKSLKFYFITCMLSIGAFIVVSIAKRGGVYLGITDIYYVFLLIGFWVYSRKKTAAFLLLALVFGGRRGAMLGFLGAVACLGVGRKISTRAIIFVPPVLLITFLIFITDNPVRDFFLSTGVLSKFYSGYLVALRDTDGSFGEMLFRMFDDRMSEIRSVLINLSDSVSAGLFGRGAGFQYLVEFPYRKEAPFLVRGVHFSPVGIYAHYGLLGFLFLYAFFLRIILRAIKFLRPGAAPAYFVCAFFTVAYFIDTFTGFSLFSSPLFAICAGIIMNPEAVAPAPVCETETPSLWAPSPTREPQGAH